MLEALLDDIFTGEFPTDHISASQVNTYLRCPLQYYWRYCEGMKIPPVGAVTLGKSVHKALEFNYKQKVETKRDLPTKEVQEVFAATFDALAPQTQFEADENPGQMLDEGVKLVGLYQTDIAPNVTPVVVEQEFKMDLDGVTFIGFIDLVARNGGGQVVHDHKTGKKTPNPDSLIDDVQMSAYDIGHLKLFGEPPVHLRQDHLVRLKQPKIVTITTTRDEMSRRRFKKTVKRVSEAIRRGIYYPNPHNFMCRPNGCGYWQACHSAEVW